MDLILWRHAEAEDGVPDLARPLTAEGHRQAARVAAWLRRHLPENYLLLASPAARAQQTAQALGKAITTVAALAPGASVQAIIAAAGDTGTVVLVGHQPDLGTAIAYLVSGKVHEWRLDKGALWWLGGGGKRVRAVVSPDLL